MACTHTRYTLASLLESEIRKDLKVMKTFFVRLKNFPFFRLLLTKRKELVPRAPKVKRINLNRVAKRAKEGKLLNRHQ